MKKNGNTIKIGDQVIGDGYPTYLIAEIGINHNGDVNLAKKLIDIAAESNMDAVKFQKRDLPSLYSADMLNNTYKYEQHYQYTIPILKNVELTDDEFLMLKKYSVKKGLEFLCTPFDIKSADSLANIGVNAFKIASADLTNLELLEHTASMGKPMIVSTGMSYWEDIEKGVEVLRKSGIPFALLHCRSVYPVWPREVNLEMINRLKKFDCPVGYSGHEIGIVIPLVAASMGACIIEKHITLDMKMPGPDHKISLEFQELKRLARDIRVADQAMGKASRFLLRGEIMNRELLGKSLIAKVRIKSGTLITREMIKVQGPGKGLAPNKIDDLVGKTVYRDIEKDAFFIDDDLNGEAHHDFSGSFKGRWGLISRFNDFEEIIALNPKIVEFHLAENDCDFDFKPQNSYSQELIVHVPEYMGDRIMDLCSSDEKFRKESVALFQKFIDFTRSISSSFHGTAKVLAHPGGQSLNTKLDKQPLRDALIKSFREINSDGVEALLENVPPYPWHFGGQWKCSYFMDADDVVDFCEETGVKICFDTSHAALYCNAKDKSLADYTGKVRPYISHIHFADAYGLDGEGVQIGDGDINFIEVMAELKDYKGSWVPEVWRGHLQNGKGFIEALNKLKVFGL